MKILGLDIGSSSVGSAWVDTVSEEIYTGVSVFPAGVEERSDGRGDPRNHARRFKRSQRVGIRRRSDRKLALRKALQDWGWMPKDRVVIAAWMQMNPWRLRRDGLSEALSPTEFGRVLLHMSQRRGPSWFDDEEVSSTTETESTDKRGSGRPERKKKPLKAVNEALVERLGERTFGQFMADLFDERHPKGKPIRNRQDQQGQTIYEFFPSRQMLRGEFERLWKKQRSFPGELAEQLTDERKLDLANPSGTDVWKCQGLLWGQRNTYWDAGTLGRCDLEPTDRVCPKADMYAQEFLTLQDVNNIRVICKGEPSRRLNPQERKKVLGVLERQKTATAKTVRAALGLNRKDIKDLVTLNVEHDSPKRLNTNWFVREIVAAIGRDAWTAMPPKTREGVNRAVCKFDPREPADVEKLTAGAKTWWGLSQEQAIGLVAAWRTRPGPESRIKLSRRAVRNLLPYLREGDSVTEARQRFAEDADNGATDERRQRYRLGGYRANHAVRHFLSKHPDQLPPAPMLANPVVRKAIHEVRRHVSAYIRKFGCKPDRVIVELARDARLSGKRVNEIVADNKRNRNQREAIRRDPELAYVFQDMRKHQVNQAIERILLCRAQRGVCAYSNLDGNEGRCITDRQAAAGLGLETDHIIPRSRGGSNRRGNKVLCYAATNRGKGDQTPKEWLSEEHFAELARRFRHWEKGPKEDRTRWCNLHRDVFDMEAYIQSQLTDTAYASRQVIQWLDQVLYGGEVVGGPSKRRVFATNGRYTSLLRRNWGLFFDESNPDADEKSRADHRHHAIDAVVIACTGPKRIAKIAATWREQEYALAKGRQPRRFTIDTPWGDHDSFRGQVLDVIRNQVVSHRSERRKIVGEFHKETLYGPILDEDGELTDEFTQRISVAKLTANHLRVPEYWEALREKLEHAETGAEKKALRRQLLNLPDVPAAKSGVVRDRWCREELRQCLRNADLDPDAFTDRDIKRLIRADKLRLADGRAAKKVTLRKVFNYTVRVPRRVPDMRTHRRVLDPNPQSTRVYEAQSNHHMEIREDTRGKWVGKIVTTFEAARRVRPPRTGGQVPAPAVDRTDNADGKFIMSLAVGETLHMAHPKTGLMGYFVVFKLDNGKPPVVHVKPHWDAGKATAGADHPVREDVPCSSDKLRQLGPDGGSPRKVWVGPLGEVKAYTRD